MDQHRSDEGLADLHKRMEAGALPAESVLSLIRSATRIDAAVVHELVFDLARTELAKTSSFLDAVSRNAEATYEGEDHDWLLELTGKSRKGIDAVSLHNVDVGRHHFLAGDLGRRYLAEQARVCDRGVRVRRIHVLEAAGAHSAELRTICRQQRELGIEVRTLDPMALADPADPLRDVVVFDEAVSYETTPAVETSVDGPIIVATRLVFDTAKVRRRLAWFGELWEAAAPFEG